MRPCGFDPPLLAARRLVEPDGGEQDLPRAPAPPAMRRGRLGEVHASVRRSCHRQPAEADLSAWDDAFLVSQRRRFDFRCASEASVPVREPHLRWRCCWPYFAAKSCAEPIDNFNRGIAGLRCGQPAMRSDFFLFRRTLRPIVPPENCLGRASPFIGMWPVRGYGPSATGLHWSRGSFRPGQSRPRRPVGGAAFFGCGNGGTQGRSPRSHRSVSIRAPSAPAISLRCRSARR